jgi:hypothetical protein
MKETQDLSQSMKLVIRKCSIPIVFGSIIIISGGLTEQVFLQDVPKFIHLLANSFHCCQCHDGILSAQRYASR